MGRMNKFRVTSASPYRGRIGEMRRVAAVMIVVAAGSGIAPALAWAPSAASENALTIQRTLTAVSALSADDAWAVSYVKREDGERTLIKHWDGTSWTRTLSANPDDQLNRLLGVKALAPDDVWAVGSAGVDGVAQPMIQHWDGSSWTQVASPRGSDRTSELTSVDAFSPTDIWAVGYQDFEFGDAEVVLQHWNGSTWSNVENANPTWLHRELTGVAVLSAKNVWAVGLGYQDDEAGLAPISLHWDGRSWTQVAIKVDDSQDDNPLFGVDGVSRDLWGVGYHSRGGILYDPLAEHFNGTKWKHVETPSPAVTVLYAVSAAASDDVWAVGAAGDGPSSFVLHWDGTTWSQVEAPSRGASTTLDGVSALTPDDAWAVGTSGAGSRTSALIEHWDGQRWTIAD